MLTFPDRLTTPSDAFWEARPMTTNTLQSLAETTRKYFTTDTRTDGTEFIKGSDDAPEWVKEMCQDAHGKMFPDDWRYAFIVEALDALADHDDPDDISMEADIYTHELTAWLASRVDRSCYCDQAMEEYGSKFPGVFAVLSLGQIAEKEEVLASVRAFLETRIDNS
jgi:hypothetical protein